MKLKNKKGFTLIEMLVVVLIIGILAGIALPQYQMAVTKAKVASILPIMRAWKDAYIEYKLINDTYCKDAECNYPATITDLGIDCPEGWSCYDSTIENEYWVCLTNEDGITGQVYCGYKNPMFIISMYQSDDPLYEDVAGLTTCETYDADANAKKVCKTLGGKLLGDATGYGVGPVYQL